VVGDILPQPQGKARLNPILLKEKSQAMLFSEQTQDAILVIAWVIAIAGSVHTSMKSRREDKMRYEIRVVKFERNGRERTIEKKKFDDRDKALEKLEEFDYRYGESDNYEVVFIDREQNAA
jgi:hypothetical protein